jgi:rare lipoprotein A
LRLAIALFVAALVAAGCGSTPKRNPYYSDDGPPEKVPDGLEQVPDAVPRDEAFNKFANRPYTVFGVTYVPVVDREPFRQRGLASWYGRKFQGQKTASGEPYDMFKMTAAHKTLPIPSYAKVTNLANGKSVVVRINDRGPFHTNRIIDLSYAAAVKIGIAAKGSGMVEVERVFEPPKEEARAGAPAMPAQGEGPQAGTPSASSPSPALSQAVAAAAEPPAFATVRTPLVDAQEGGVWIQLGAFSSPEAANAFRDKAARSLTWILEPIQVEQRDGLSRVRLGPYRNRAEADAIAQKVRDSLGYAPSIVDRQESPR